VDCKLIYSAQRSIDYATDLLTYSNTCSISGVYGDYCPDPHGILYIYEYNFAKAQSYGSFEVYVKDEEKFEAAEKRFQRSLLFFGAGALLLIFAVFPRKITYRKQGPLFKPVFICSWSVTEAKGVHRSFTSH